MKPQIVHLKIEVPLPDITEEITDAIHEKLRYIYGAVPDNAMWKVEMGAMHLAPGDKLVIPVDVEMMRTLEHGNV